MNRLTITTGGDVEQLVRSRGSRRQDSARRPLRETLCKMPRLAEQLELRRIRADHEQPQSAHHRAEGQAWWERLKPPFGLTLVAPGDGLPVYGFCVAMMPSRDDDALHDVAEIAALWTDPGHRRTGIAWDLMIAMQRMLAERGFRSATLWVLEDNAPARALYRRLGWEEDGARKAGEGAPELRLWRALT